MSTTTTSATESAPIRVGVIGAGGRMGRTICAGIAADPAFVLVAAIDPHVAGETIAGVTVAGELDALTAAGAQVAIDFTVVSAARVSVPWLAAHGIHAVVGTTGFSDDDVGSFRAAFTTSNCLIASNFSITAVLMMRFAEMAAPYFETAEIIELHHNGKADAPSGTAVTTAKRMAAASPEWAADPTKHEVYPGARGGIGPTGIRIHSVRLRGLQAHQEVILGTVGQSLTIRQDSYDNSSYLPGISLACRAIGEHPGVTLGLEPLLDLGS
ncbi:MAG TPA: 4-hydroxy-tetrahydrodipicolinate reductase [Ilumatobacteraceae bacterium]|nr:4-hydroxy-tetrahydrodipicolinate reductase [Ilumatobacteraceae bacterium]